MVYVFVMVLVQLTLSITGPPSITRSHPRTSECDPKTTQERTALCPSQSSHWFPMEELSATRWVPECRHGSHGAPHRGGRGQAPAPAGPHQLRPRSAPHSDVGDRWLCSGTSRSPGRPGSRGRRYRRRRPRSGRAPGRRRRSPGEPKARQSLETKAQAGLRATSDKAGTEQAGVQNTATKRN